MRGERRRRHEWSLHPGVGFSTSHSSQRLVSPGTRTTLAASSTGITPRGLRRSPWSLAPEKAPGSPAPRPHRAVASGNSAPKSSSQSRLHTPDAKLSSTPPTSPARASENRRCHSTSALEASPVSPVWPAAAQCWKVLSMLEPLKATLTGVASPGKPAAADVHKLRGHCTAVAAAVAELQQALNEDSRTAAGNTHGQRHAKD